MEQLRQRLLRPCRRISDIFLIAVFLSLFLSIIGTSISMVLLSRLGLVVDTSSPAYLICANDYLLFLGIWLITIADLAIFPANRPMLRQLLPTLRKGNTILRTLLGFFAGFALNALCALISILRHDIALSFNAFEPVPLLIVLFAVFIQSGAEELTDRLYLFQKLRRRYKSPLFAALVSSATFAALHLGNPGITAISLAQIVVIGFTFVLFVYYFDALGAAMAMHTAWNYTQNIIFGLPNSGIVSRYSIFKLEAASNGPFFDTVFGIEGSVGALALLSLFMLGLMVYIRVKRIEPVDIWADAEADALQKSATPTDPTAEPDQSA